MSKLLDDFPGRALQAKKANKRFLQRLGQRPPRDLDDTMLELHEEVFAEIDCLDCANCCKTTSPIFRDVDIDRIARHLGLRPAELVEQYLHLDDEGDYVLNMAPCPFLDEDHYCRIYAHRPRACREYPHTDRKHFHQILDLTYKNTLVCPATLEIIRRLRESMG